MPLIKVKAQNWSGNFAYAPPTEETLVNTDDVQSVRPCESRGTGPFVRIRFRDGKEMICVGMINDFFGKEGT